MMETVAEQLEERGVLVPVPVDEEKESVARRVGDWTGQAEAIVGQDPLTNLEIRTKDQYELSLELASAGAQMEKAWVDLYEPMRDGAYRLYKNILDERDAKVKPIQDLRKRLDAVNYTFQRKVREEEARIARENAERQAKLEEEARLQRAAMAENNGASQEAVTQILNTPVPMVQPMAPSLLSKPVDTSFKDVPDYEVTDENLVPREFLCVDHKAIKAYVRSKRGKCEILGIRIFYKGSVTHRSKKGAAA